MLFYMNTTYIFHGFYSLSTEETWKFFAPNWVSSEFRFEQATKKTLCAILGGN